ncbi:hypothetical protein [Sulfitobacter sp.]|jgi:hypothetical protein|uniref:hypothetical protein n=1 Tax=Sulfitobacter sp. TaxID=1903071 RepID=UPI0018C9D9C3|nr:hypothetical protein IT881_11160 [Erythrobacter sp. A30-3]
MATSNLYPTTPEIKRLIAAVQRASVPIGTIEIEPARIRIFTSNQMSPDRLTPFDLWQMQEAARNIDDE